MELKDLITKPKINPPRIVLYGPHKIGKTSFAMNAPNPLILAFEDGLDYIKKPDGTPPDMVDCRNDYDKAVKTIEALYNSDHDFKTVVIDTADWMEQALFNKLCKIHNTKSIIDNEKGSPFSYGRGIDLARNELGYMLDGLSALRNDKGMAIIILAHSQIRTVDDPTNASFDQHVLKMNQKIASKILEWSDCILFANNKVFAENGKATASARMLFTDISHMHTGGNRFKLPPELPFTETGAWQAFIEAYSKAVSPQPQPAAKGEKNG